MLIAGFVPLADLADLLSIGTLFAFVLVAAVVAILRRTKPDMKRRSGCLLLLCSRSSPRPAPYLAMYC